MRVGDEASAMARAMAAGERDKVKADVGAGSHARKLRFQLMLALRETIAAHEKLADAVRAVVEDGTDLVLEDSPYPDDAQAYDLVQGPAMAYEQLAGWVASLEGRASLAEMMLQGPPVSRPGEGMPVGSTWSVDATEPVRAVIGAGLMLFGQEVDLSPLQVRFGPLFKVEMFELEPGGMVNVRTWTSDGEFWLRVSPQDAEDPRRLHPLLMEAASSLRQGVELGEATWAALAAQDQGSEG